MTIIDHNDGETATAISDGAVSLADIFETTSQTQRASRILPVHPVKCWWFRLLRKWFGDRGRVANWTRQWCGPWVAVLLPSGGDFTAETRAECVRWEIERLENGQDYKISKD